MIKIVKSLLGSNDIELYNELKLIMAPDTVKTLAADEIMVFKYLVSEFDANKQFPTDKVFTDKFEQYTAAISQTEPYDKTNLKYYRRQFITKKQNLFSGRVLQKLSAEAVSSGITPEMFEEVRKLAKSEDQEDSQKLSFRERYTRSMLDNSGLKTFVEQIDDQIGSITKGSVCTLAGFTGSFKCVSENERVLTNRGMLTMKEIYTIGVDSNLEVQSEYGFKKLVAVHDEGFKSSYIISIDGIPIETSPVHRFRVLTDNGELIWKEAQQLSIGDKVVQSLKESRHHGLEDDPDFWRLYGQMCGDGGCTGDTFYLCGSVDTLEAMESERLFSKFFSKFSKTITAPRKACYKPLFNLRANFKTALREELNDFVGKMSKTKVFPEKLFYLNRECWEAFVTGLYETDGCSGNSNLGFTLSNKQFLIDLSRLLSGMGISSALYHQQDDAYHLNILTAKSRNRFIDLISSVTFKANKNEKINPIKDTCRPFETRKAYLEAKTGTQLTRQDYKSFGRFGTKNGGCGFEKIRRVCENYPTFMKHSFFNEIINAELTWNQVTDIQQSNCYMYDLTVEGSPTYLLNGYVTHNTTWAVNMAIKNAMMGKNIAYISLEVTKEQLEYSVLSMFSTDSRFSMYSPLKHQDIRQNKLNQDDMDFLCDVLEPEYRRVIEPNFHILDESVFKTFSESEILDVLYKLDDEKPLDAVFFDHAGLFAFKSPLYNAGNVGVAINKYVSFIREISICFRKKNGENRGLSSVLLAQTNRTGFREAAKSFRQSGPAVSNNKKGNPVAITPSGYSLTALSDANELERCSSVVVSVFANDDMKSAKCVKAQLLKTRYGEPLPPLDVQIEPEFYKFGGDASVPEQELSADLLGQLSECSISRGSAGTSITSEDVDYGLL